MPDCYCCWVSRHYSSAPERGQGEIHDALFFMTGGISLKDDQLMVNVTADRQVPARPGKRRRRYLMLALARPRVIVAAIRRCNGVRYPELMRFAGLLLT
jgi:hypothetical protein